MKILLIVLLIGRFLAVNAQVKSDSSWVAGWRTATVAFGRIISVNDSTIRGRNFNHKEFSLLGTGVFAYVTSEKLPGKLCAVIITAAHMFYSKKENWDPKTIQIRLYGSESLSFKEYMGLTLNLKKDSKRLWIHHQDSTVDLACIPITGQTCTDSNLTQLHTVAPIPYTAFGTSEEIFDGSQIATLGFPGLASYEILSKPLVRQGIIAWTNPTDPLNDNFMIDCNIFPGNSGGPVFSLPYGIGRNGKMINGGYVKFIGIVSQVYSEKQYLKSTKDREAKSDLYYTQRAALGVVVPSNRVKELLERTVSTMLANPYDYFIPIRSHTAQNSPPSSPQSPLVN